MTEHFDEAAVRHYRDGDLLSGEGRIANADQLFGFAAECAIKAALVTLPSCAQSGSLALSYQQHVSRLWELAPLQNLQKRYPGLLNVLKSLRPFDDWSVDQRYGPDEAITVEALDSHREAAKRVLGATGLTGIRRNR